MIYVHDMFIMTKKMCRRKLIQGYFMPSFNKYDALHIMCYKKC